MLKSSRSWRLCVSIRFKVRGGFRLELGARPGKYPVVSIRFKVRGGFRRVALLAVVMLLLGVSIRFKVRGGFRPAPSVSW